MATRHLKMVSNYDIVVYNGNCALYPDWQVYVSLYRHLIGKHVVLSQMHIYSLSP